MLLMEMADETDSAVSPTTVPRRVFPGWLASLLHVGIHLFCIGLYLIPILQPNEYAGPTLDELHIMSSDNADVNGNSSLMEILKNDYWGRPMQSESSHKSWRPLTVLSFRYLKGMDGTGGLTTHRLVNIVTHAATAEVVGILATRLFPQKTAWNQFLLRALTKIVFVLHPTHVEVTANAANRNHILSLLFSTILCDPDSGLWVFLIALICGFLASETFLFQVPAAMVTLVAIHEASKRTATQSPLSENLWAVFKSLFSSIFSVLPRLILMISALFVYLAGRAYFDTLNIPEGLIRPAENPFHPFTGEHRLRNYLYTFSIHVAKSWGLDPIGFSHEYGFDCVPAIEDWHDQRLALPCFILISFLLAMVAALRYPATLLGPVAVHFAWLLTLFPVTGFLKVGTFISDRIVVPSTVSVCLLVGLMVHCWATHWMNRIPAKPLQTILLGWLLVISYVKVHTRSLQWMDSKSLIESSLETCPRFAKAQMEMSKIYSGLFPALLDLAKARKHLEEARAIDPDFCDLHQQFAHVAAQEGNMEEYEEELTQAVLCPFTMMGALGMWRRYWDVALGGAVSEHSRARIEERRSKFTKIIEAAVAEAQEKETST